MAHACPPVPTTGEDEKLVSTDAKDTRGARADGAGDTNDRFVRIWLSKGWRVAGHPLNRPESPGGSYLP